MTTDPRDAWAVEPKPLPDGLDAQAEPYQDPWNSIMERLSLADRDALRLIAAGGVGEAIDQPRISYRHTEIGGE